MRKLLLILCLLIGCGQSHGTKDSALCNIAPVEVAPDIGATLVFLTDQFYTDFHVPEMMRVTIVTTNLVDQGIAVGYATTCSGFPYVLLDSSFVTSNSVDQIRVLVYHELGHALLGKQHDDSKIGIMNTYLPGWPGEETWESWLGEI